jgi:hypothetical protein
MADRTYCQIQVAAAHRAQFEPIFEARSFSEQEGGTDNLSDAVAERSSDLVTFEHNEADYGGEDIIVEIRALALPFTGYHDAGDASEGAVFACGGATYAECSGDSGGPLCQIGDDGDPVPAGLANARDYLAVYKLAAALMKTESEPEPEIGLCVDCGTQCVAGGDLSVLCPECDANPEESE